MAIERNSHLPSVVYADDSHIGPFGPPPVACRAAVFLNVARKCFFSLEDAKGGELTHEEPSFPLQGTPVAI